MDVEPIIEAVELTKTFRDFWHRPRVRAVRGITFSVRPGEVFGLLGPNGSGKSTTIKMILGLLHPGSGELRVLGESPDQVPMRERLGFLPEESYLYPYLTCEETLDFFGKLFPMDASTRRERVDQLLEMIGLQHARKRPVGELSKGMARRIALAQALINDPDLIILDEPTSGLDPLGCRQVKDLIAALAQRGKTILLSSHLLADVEDVCDRIAILYNGSLRAMGPIHELLEDKSRYQLTLPELPPDAMKQLLARLREALGTEPDVERPKINLERFFLEVVRQAQNNREEYSGAQNAGMIAPYLQQQPTTPNPADGDQATP